MAEKALSTVQNLCSAGTDLTHGTQDIPSLKKQFRNTNVGRESLCRSLNQCLRSCVKCRSGRRQCVCSIVSPFVQSGGDLPVNVDFCRVSFDPYEVELSRGFQSQLRHRLIPQIRIAFVVQLSFTLSETSSNTHDISPSDLISKSPSCTRMA